MKSNLYQKFLDNISLFLVLMKEDGSESQNGVTVTSNAGQELKFVVMLHAKIPVTVRDIVPEVLASASMDSQVQVATLHVILNVLDAQPLNVLSASQITILKTEYAKLAQLNAQHANQQMIALVVKIKAHFINL
jgi:hypothetical protein